MSIVPDRTNPYTVTQVSLAPISDNQQNDENLEPPFIRIRRGNECFIFVDSEVRQGSDGVPQALTPDLFNATDFALGGGSHQFYARKIKRLNVGGFQFAACSPNVNPRNNVLTFFSTTSGANHTVVVREGLYVTAATLVAALVGALNTATGASGLTWSALVNPVNACQWTLSVVGGTYHFVLTSLMILYGRYLYNLPQEQANTASKTFGAVFGLYSRHIDVVSLALTEYSKNPTSSNASIPNGVIARAFFKSPLGGAGGIPIDGLSFFATDVVANVNYDRSRALEVIDISLRDEFNQPFYIPSYSSGSPPNSMFDMVVEAEL